MAQNTSKASKAAQRALQGAQITHILPLDAHGRHTPAQLSADWGCIEDGRLTKNCAAVLNAASVAAATGKAVAEPKKRKRELEEETYRQRTCLCLLVLALVLLYKFKFVLIVSQ